jgi:6-phosphogluconolactonase (cycloisomerase 2 family)
MNNQVRPYNLSSFIGLWLLAMLIGTGTAHGRIPEPDFVIYGSATIFGQELAPNTLVSVNLVGDPVALADYRMQSDPLLGSLYAVRIPMDSVDPRSKGTARTGELAELMINGQFAAQFQIGEQGIQVLEGSGGTSTVNFTLSLSDTSETAASVRVDTQSDSALGGGTCSTNVDFISVGRTATIAAGQLSTTVAVSICGDLLEESEEQFFLNLSSPQDANILDGQGIATITDDDLAPDISVNDVVFAEPSSGSDTLAFTVSLNQAWSDNVIVNYATISGTAISGVDFVPASGTAIINSGDLSTQVLVEIFSDMDIEQNETFSLILSNPINGRFGDDTGIATLIDLQFDPVLEPAGQVSDANGDGDLLNPSDVFVTQNNRFAFVSARGSDSIVAFTRDPGTGSLSIPVSYTNAMTGFETAPLDGASSVTATPDNEFLYVAAANDDAIGIYDLDPVAGTIGFLGSVVNNSGATGIDGVTELLISSNGNYLYAAGTTEASIAVFAVDPVTGMLSFVADISEGDASGSGTIDGLEQVSGLAGSADDAFLYATGKADNAVSVYGINPADGTLTYLETHRHQALGVRGIANATDVKLSPDGLQVFVSGAGIPLDGDSSGFAIFDRDPVTGLLTYLDAVHPGDAGVAGMLGAQAIAVAGDGQTVTVAGFADDSLTIFNRVASPTDPNFGMLTVAETRRDGEGGNELMGGPSRIAISPDGQFMYVVAETDNAVSVFKILNFQMVFTAGFEDL